MVRDETESDAALRRACPSFLDLRAFAAAVTAESEAVPRDTANAFLDSRWLIDLPEGPVTIGAIRLNAGRGAVQMPADEFVIVHSGMLTIERDAGSLALSEGKSAVLQRGAGFTWSASGPTTLVFMRYAGSQQDEAGIVAIDEAAQLEPSGAPLAELLIGPTPQCRNYTDYRSADGEFMCGTWDSTPYHRRAMAYRHYELMHLLEGSVTFEDEAGRRGTFGKGDIFLVEQHAQCSWESTVDVTKVYAIYRPAA